MTAPQPIAKVATISGKAFIRQQSGKLEPIKVGDLIYSDTKIIEHEGGHVELQNTDGAPFTMEQQEALRMSGRESDTPNNPTSTISENSSFSSSDGMSSVGRAGSGEDDGNNFVRVRRIEEDVEPASLGLDPLIRVVEEIRPGALREPEETGAAELAETPETEVTPPLSDPDPAETPPTITITDNDSAAFSIDDISINEATGDATFTISLSAPSAGATSVDYATAADTATGGGTDFTDVATTTVNFAAGETSKDITVPIIGDVLFEGAEQFFVNLSNATGGATIADNQGIGTIYDNGSGPDPDGPGPLLPDNDTPTLSVSSASYAEDAGFAEFTVSIDNTSVEDISFDLALTDDSATGSGTDYGTAGAGNLQVWDGSSWNDATSATIAAGSTSVTVRTPISDDALDESSELFDLTATVTAGTTTNVSDTGTITITDNDSAAFSIDDISINEATGDATFTISLSAPSAGATSVDYATAADTATGGGTDFTDVATTTVNFAAGETSKDITVPIIGDVLFEGAEQFFVNLSNATGGATIADNQGIGTIYDNGSGPDPDGPGPLLPDNDTPTLSVSSASYAEDAGFAEFTVSIDNTSVEDISFDLALTDDSATGSGTDYGTAGAGNLQVWDGSSWNDATSATIAAGSTSVTVRTPISDDALDESSELFDLTATVTAGTTTNVSDTGTITITDNDSAAFSIDDISINEATGDATFTISLSAPSAGATSVDYATAADTATGGGTDFTDVATTTVNFAAGETSKDITVPIIGDVLFEGAEQFFVNLSNATGGATIADNQGIGTIYDNGSGPDPDGPGPLLPDNDTPTLSVSSASYAEDAGFAEFTVSIDNTSVEDISFDLALTDDSATGSGTDYGTAGAGNLQVWDGSSWNDATSATIAAGSTSVTVRTPISDDALDESSELFDLTATVTAGTTTNVSDTGTITITDNDSAAFSIDDISINEATGDATFTISLSAPSAGATSVDYATAADTATGGGTDFTDVATTTVNFAAGETSKDITVPIIGDVLFEGAEQFFVNLSNATGGATIADNQGIGTIYDNGSGPDPDGPGPLLPDNDTPTLSVSSASYAEDAGFAEFTVSIDNTSVEDISFDLALTDDSATGSGTDYGTAGAGNLQVWDGSSWNDATSATIAAGSTSVTVRTPISDDALDESSELFDLTATVTAGTTTNVSDTGTITITDNDSAAFSIDDISINEATGDATFTISLSAPSAGATSVDYATAADTATGGGTDFTDVATTTVNFAAGETSKDITVPIIGDVLFEGAEQFFVNLSNATGGATIADNQGIGTIYDNGSGPDPDGPGPLLPDNDTPTLSVSSASYAEDAGFAEFTVSIDNTSVEDISFDLALTDDSATGSGTDYGTAGAGNLQVWDGSSWNDATSATIAAGSTSVTVRTPISDDALDESSELFDLTATVTAGTTTNVSDTGTITITDNDSAAFSIDDISINEATGDATFTISLSAPSAGATSVDYATAADTATGGGTDFTDVATTTVNFAAGETSKDITVPIIGDVLFEGAEQFFVNLSNATGGATIADNQGIGTIYDNGSGPDPDGPGPLLPDNDTPTLSVSSASYAEDAGFAEFTVSIDNTSVEDISFDLALTDDSATGSGTDYGTAGAGNLQVWDGSSWNDATSATIAAGSTSVTVRTPISDDALDESSELFDLTATVTAGTTTNVSDTGTITITDNDSAAFSIDDISINEATGDATFTISLSAPSAGATSVDYATAADTATGGGTDFTDVATTTVNFAAGETSKDITVPIIGDVLFEGAEQFFVNLSNATGGATIADNQGIGTIYDNGSGPDPDGPGPLLPDNDTPTLSVSSASYAEDAGFAEFTVSIDNTSVEDISFDLALTDDSATGSGTDYGTAGAGNLQVWDGSSWNDATSATIAAGSTSVTVRTPISDDALDESSELFDLTATVTAGTTTNVSDTGTITITDNDSSPTAADSTIAIAKNSTQVLTADDFGFSDPDGDSLATVQITSLETDGSLLFYNGTTWQDVTLNQVVTKADIDNCYLVFRPDIDETNTAGTVTTAIEDADSSRYAQFSFTVNDGVNDSLVSNTITYSVNKELTVSDPAAIDEGKSAVFMIDLSESRAVNTVLDLTVGGDVTAGDYDANIYYKDIAADGQWTWTLAVGNQVTIAAGDTRVEVKVTTIADAVPDNAEELTLTAVTNGALSGDTSDMANLADTGATTINDYPTLLVSAPVFVSEGNEAIFEVGLSSVKATDTFVDLTIGGEAVAADYNPVYQYSTDDGTTWANVVGNQITILGDASAITSVLVKITTIDDATPEGDELLTLVVTTADPVVTTSGIANAGAEVSDSTVIVDKVQLSVSEEEDGVAIIGVSPLTDTVVDTAADANYTYEVLGQGANGTVTDNGDGTLRYTPDTDFSGTDTFAFTKIDAAGNRTTAEAEVTVTAVADMPNITITVNNSVSNTVASAELIINGGFELADMLEDGIADAVEFPEADNPGTDVQDGQVYGWTMSTPSEILTTSGDSRLTLTDPQNGNETFITQAITSLAGGSTSDHTITFDYSGISADAGISGEVFWGDGTTWVSIGTFDTSGGNPGVFTGTITAGQIDGVSNILRIDGVGSIGGGGKDGIAIDNVSLTGPSTTTYTYDVNITTSLNDTDEASAQPEELQPVTVTGVPASGVFSAGIDNGGGSWTFTQAELDGLTITMSEADATAVGGFTLVATTTSQELSSLDLSPVATASVTYEDTNDVPLIGDNTLIMANEANFVGSVTDTIETYFSIDGGNTFTWDEAASTLPTIFSEGQLVAITFDDVTGTITGTIGSGAKTVFSVNVNMQDNDLTDITYNQPNELLGVEEIFDGGIVLPGGGNNETIVLGFNDSDGNQSNVDAIIVAHNLIEDTAAEIASPTAEHTVNTNNYYIGVDSNNMNAGDQLIMDFATVASDVDGNTSHANEVSQMEISLFNFGSEKSGDELYITVLTENPAFPGDISNAIRETIILTGDSDLNEMKYTVTSPSGGTFIGVEFLAGNESSFKLGIESISAINYNTDFDMVLGYDITDTDGDSDSGSVTISLDGDETILYDSTKTAIDAGDEQTAGGAAGDDILVLATGDNINFDNSIVPAIPELKNFEVIDLTQNGDHTLSNLSVADVTNMTDDGNALEINADAADSVQLTNEWQQIGVTNVYEDITTQTINVTINGLTPTLTSTIVDAPIIGMKYETTSGLSGTTNADGSFSYISGDSVTFMLGSLVLGVFDTEQMASDGQLFLQDLAGVDRTNLSDEYVTNLAVLLQSIDENSIAEDGLVITEAMHQAFADDAFNLNELTEEQVVSMINEAGREAVSEEQAMAHVQDELIARTDLTADDFTLAENDPEFDLSSSLGLAADTIPWAISTAPAVAAEETSVLSNLEPSVALTENDLLETDTSVEVLLAELPIAEVTNGAIESVPADTQNFDFVASSSTELGIIKAMIDSTHNFD